MKTLRFQTCENEIETRSFEQPLPKNEGVIVTSGRTGSPKASLFGAARVFSTLLLLAISCSSSFGAEAYVPIKNTDSISHSYCVYKNIGSGWQHDPDFCANLSAGETRTVHRTAATGDAVKIAWGAYGPDPHATSKPYNAMRADNGSTEWAMPDTNSDHTSPNFEFVAVTIYGNTLTTEGSTYGIAFGRTGSTSYPLLVSIDALGTAVFSATGDFSKDWSLYDGSGWVNPATGLTIPTGVGTKNTTVYVWADGVSMETAETATIRVNAASYYEPSWTGTSTTATIAAN